jgi:UDP-glucose 4-epimerase
MAILVTGGAGYIGSHTVVEMLNEGMDLIIVDNYCNSKPEVLNRIEKITGKMPRFYEIDCTDKIAFKKIFEKENITDVIHFAGLKAVGESVRIPLRYYTNNLNSTIVLLELMLEFGVKNIVFSSSATVYGTPKRMPIYETDPTGETTNPYGATKLIIEGMLKNVQKVHPEMNVILLRYFNPIGAHASGLIGEDPNGIPNNLMPFITQVAVGKLFNLGVFGNDFNTVDGTGVRDYIHVVDLAKGHLAALRHMKSSPGLAIYNLGTGKGTSVLQMVSAFENANNIKIPYVITGRREGDIDSSYANCDKVEKELGWKAHLSVIDACRDSWNWQKKNPKGYEI